MARQIAFTRNPLASTQLDKSAQISEKVRSVFDRGGSAQVHKQSTIKLEWLRPSPTQPRKTFDPQALEDLQNSIREHGVLEPLIVRLQGDHYEIICGERRFRAASALGLKEVPITVLDLTDEEAYAVSLHENIHRDNLTPVDEANAYRQLMAKGLAANQQAVAKFVGVSQSRVSQKLALLEMPEEIQTKIRAGSKASKSHLTERHARLIRQAGSSEKQKALADRVINQALSVSKTAALVREETSKRPTRAAPKPSAWVTDGPLRYRRTPDGLSVEIEAADTSSQLQALTRLMKALKK